MKSKGIIYIFFLLIAQIGVLKGDEPDDIVDRCSAALNIPSEAFSLAC